MRQIVCNLRSGAITLVEVPAPALEPGHLLIRTRRSLLSQGTEKMLVQFGKASLFQKARSQPEKVKQVLAKVRSEGVVPTIEAVFRRLDEPLPLGYCNVGTVIGTGSGVSGYSVGDRVVSNGPHAEVVSVPVNLCAKVPEGVSDDSAAFAVVGAIALQGVRLVKPEFGETVVVIGLGLIGQITTQLLQAAGCRVIGFDFDDAKVAMAAKFGATALSNRGEVDPVRFVTGATGGMGADAVIITASTPSNEVIAQSAKMSRKRGRIVLVGVVGLNINRSDFYEKELSFQVSCSYGPGRYDDAYEEKGHDYPAAFVRWTEGRNFQAIVEAMQAGRINVQPLITRRARFEGYQAIYDNIDGGLASILTYGDDEAQPAALDSRLVAGANSSPSRQSSTAETPPTTLRITDRVFTGHDSPLAIIGAGNFTKMAVLPALDAAAAPVKTIVSAGGLTATTLAKKYRIPFSSSDLAGTLADPEIRGVIITTRHNLHATQIVDALGAGKHVLVEKPLCLTFAELKRIEAALATAPVGTTLTVGYNRRFSPHTEKMKALLGGMPGPVSVVATMNAGAIPSNHWVHDPEVGGGRLVGEACHLIDLALHLTGSLITELSATQLDGANDCASILLRHENGSVSVVNYFAHGHREVSKERVEVHSHGRTLLLDNFRELRAFGFRAFSKFKTSHDKGHTKQFALFAQRVRENGGALIKWEEIVNSTRATLAIPVAMAERRWVRLAELTGAE